MTGRWIAIFDRARRAGLPQYMARRMTRRGLPMLLAAVLAIVGDWTPARAQSKEPVVVGVCGPLTGQYAQYGAQWKKGFDLALDEINASGGINGRPLQYVFEDSQSDPRQTVAIARKFVADERIVVEVGDFSSAASMAASPIYQAAGLVQFGFTNSHPKFTQGGDYIWSNAVNQQDEMPLLADFLRDLGLKQIAILHINSDWGRTAKDLLVEAVKQRGGTVVGAEGYLTDEKDFRSAIVRLRDADPDGIALVSYYPDGAQITRQIKNAGLKQRIVAGGSIYSPKFIELGGDAVNGVLTTVPFFPQDPRPEVQKFVKGFVAKFGEQPDAYNGRAYDTMILLASVMRKSGTERKNIRDGLATISGVPSVVFGQVKFDPNTRRVANPIVSRIGIEKGEWIPWTGKQ